MTSHDHNMDLNEYCIHSIFKGCNRLWTSNVHVGHYYYNTVRSANDLDNLRELSRDTCSSRVHGTTS